MGKVVQLMIILGGLLYSQIIPSAEYAGSAYANIATEANNFSALINPSLISKNQTGVALSFSSNIYGIPDLRVKSLAGTINTDNYSINLIYLKYGFDLYKENLITFGVSKKVIENLFVGISGNCNFLFIKNYGNKTQFHLNIGLNFDPSKKISAGFSVRNILLTQTRKTNELSELEIISGIKYSAIKNFNLYAGIRKKYHREISFSLALNYSINNIIELSGGYSLNPSLINYGIKLSLNGVFLNIAYVSHTYLPSYYNFDLGINL